MVISSWAVLAGCSSTCCIPRLVESFSVLTQQVEGAPSCRNTCAWQLVRCTHVWSETWDKVTRWLLKLWIGLSALNRPHPLFCGYQGSARQLSSHSQLGCKGIQEKMFDEQVSLLCFYQDFGWFITCQSDSWSHEHIIWNRSHFMPSCRLDPRLD